MHHIRLPLPALDIIAAVLVIVDRRSVEETHLRGLIDLRRRQNGRKCTLNTLVSGRFVSDPPISHFVRAWCVLGEGCRRTRLGACGTSTRPCTRGAVVAPPREQAVLDNPGPPPPMDVGFIGLGGLGMKRTSTVTPWVERGRGRSARDGDDCSS